MIPQIIYLTLLFIALLIMANQHGQPRTGNHNFWLVLMGWAIEIGILYWGGFFDCWTV